MSQGYLLIGLGQKYIVENYHLAKTIRKQGDKRPISLIVHPEDSEFARQFMIFDDIIEFVPDNTDPVYADCTCLLYTSPSPRD